MAGGLSFRVAIAALVGIAVAAVAVAIAVAVGGSSASASAVVWSQWAPSGSNSTAPQQIADHVSPYYLLTAAQQLDVVTPIHLSNSGAAGVSTGSGLTVAISSGSSSQSLGVLSGKTVAYNLCGTGSAGDCSLTGTPSQARLLLLRREALELALYTLRYVSDTSNVVVVLPPGHASSSTAKVTVAVLFDRAELQPWLQVPLAQTLAVYPPVASQAALWTKTGEAGLVDQITGRGLFSERIETQQVGGSLLVLTPLPAQ